MVRCLTVPPSILLNWSRGQRDEALCLLEQWGDEPAFAPFYYTRAQLRSWGNKNDPLADLSKGQKMDRTWRGYFKMAVFLREMHDYEKALEWARQGEEKFPQNHIIQFEYARVLLYNRDYDQAIELLMDITILPHEGAQSGREVWRQACLLSALQRLEEGEYTGALARLEQARHWPENLGVGKPYKVDTRLEDFLQGYIFLQQKRDGAEPLLQQVVSYTKNKVKEFNVEYYIYILALEHLGKKEKAEALLNEWHKRSAQDRLADWVYHHYHKKGVYKEKLSFGGNTDFLLVEKISSIMDKIK